MTRRGALAEHSGHSPKENVFPRQDTSNNRAAGDGDTSVLTTRRHYFFPLPKKCASHNHHPRDGATPDIRNIVIIGVNDTIRLVGKITRDVGAFLRQRETGPAYIEI